MLVLSVTAAVVTVAWVVLVTVPAWRWPRELSLPEDASALREEAEPERVVALVPARDEASLLGQTLPALLGQGGLEGVVLVDDASTDGTGDVARALAGAESVEGSARLEVVRVDEHAPGWSGKVAAQVRGLERARERFGDFEWLLLVDADIRLRPGALLALLAVARDRRSDLVSVMARLRAVSFWERLLVPPFVFFFHLLYPFRRVANDRSRVAAAAGGCVLVRREAFERAGGFEAIRDRLIDDVALARCVKRAGGRLWLGFDDGIESVRPYESLREVWRMIARNAFVQLGFSWVLLLLTLLGLAVFVVLPPFGLGVAVAVGIALGWSAEAVVSAASFAVAWLLQVVALRPAVRHHRAGSAFAWTLPVAAALYGTMTASSAWAHARGRTSRWRGREYRRGSSSADG